MIRYAISALFPTDENETKYLKSIQLFRAQSSKEGEVEGEKKTVKTKAVSVQVEAALTTFLYSASLSSSLKGTICP